MENVHGTAKLAMLEHCQMVSPKSTEMRVKITQVRSFASTLDIIEIPIEMDSYLVESMCGKNNGAR